MASRNDPWNDERDAALAKCLANKMTFEETAAKLNKQFGKNYTRCSISGRASRIRLKSQNPAARRPKEPQTPTERRSKAAGDKRRQLGHAEKVIAMPRLREDATPGAAPWRSPEVEPLNVPLLDLAHNGCRWPYGERPFVFCNQPKCEWHDSYCGSHARLSLRAA